MYKFRKKKFDGKIFLIILEIYSLVIKEPETTWKLCDRLHDWQLTQSRLKTLLTSLVTRRRVGIVADLCHFLFSSQNNATRKNEKTQREKTKTRNNACKKTKRRNNATRKDEITKPATRKVDIPTRKGEKKKRHAKRRHLKLLICCLFACFFFFFFFFFRLFTWRYFVFSHGVFSSIRLFVFSHGVFSSFRFFVCFAWRYFGAKRRNGTNQPL